MLTRILLLFCPVSALMVVLKYHKTSPVTPTEVLAVNLFFTRPVRYLQYKLMYRAEFPRQRCDVIVSAATKLLRNRRALLVLSCTRCRRCVPRVAASASCSRPGNRFPEITERDSCARGGGIDRSIYLPATAFWLSASAAARSSWGIMMICARPDCARSH